jgi:hypothetical protein
MDKVQDKNTVSVCYTQSSKPYCVELIVGDKQDLLRNSRLGERRLRRWNCVDISTLATAI